MSYEHRLSTTSDSFFISKRFPAIRIVDRRKRAAAMLCSAQVLEEFNESDTPMNPAKADEPIVMPFAIWTRVGLGNHTLVGCLHFPREEALCETYFGNTPRPVTGGRREDSSDAWSGYRYCVALH